MKIQGVVLADQIGENRRFMSFSGNSARMGIRYVPAADVASLFSEPDVLGADPGG